LYCWERAADRLERVFCPVGLSDPVLPRNKPSTLSLSAALAKGERLAGGAPAREKVSSWKSVPSRESG
jgi:hypothetical protein